MFNLEFATASVFASLNLHFLHPFSHSNKKTPFNLAVTFSNRENTKDFVDRTEKKKTVCCFLQKLRFRQFDSNCLVSFPYLLHSLVAGCKVLFCSEGCRVWSLGLDSGLGDRKLVSSPGLTRRAPMIVINGVTTTLLIGAITPFITIVGAHLVLLL